MPLPVEHWGPAMLATARRTALHVLDGVGRLGDDRAGVAGITYTLRRQMRDDERVLVPEPFLRPGIERPRLISSGRVS